MSIAFCGATAGTAAAGAAAAPQIRTVDLGPFKHRIDDGLELRKATFECLDILLTALPHVLQVRTTILVESIGFQVEAIYPPTTALQSCCKAQP